MGILDRINATSDNCQNGGFDDESMGTINAYSHHQIFASSCNNEYLDKTDYQEDNLFGIYNASDWRLYKNPIDKPFQEYDSNGSITYFWYYGDIIDLEFNLTGEAVVEENDIIYCVTGQTPTTSTVGTIDQKAYNIIDRFSWTLIRIENNEYIWELDEEYVQPEKGDRHIYFSIQDYIKNKNVCIKIQDFQYNSIYEQDFSGNQELLVHISKELSDKMVPGVYYVQLMVVDQNANNVLLGINKYRLLVK